MGNRIKPKYILLIVIFLYALLRMQGLSSHLPTLPCDLRALRTDIPLQIQEAISMDGGQKPALTRFFHNKPVFWSVNFTQCYFKYLDPLFIVNFSSLLGFFMMMIGFYFLIPKLSWKMRILIILFILIVPIFLILSIFSRDLFLIIFSFYIWFFIIYGIWALGAKIIKA